MDRPPAPRRPAGPRRRTLAGIRQSGTPYVAGAETLPRHGGIGADDLAATLRPLVTGLCVEPLGDDPDLWGRTADDERYAPIAHP